MSRHYQSDRANQTEKTPSIIEPDQPYWSSTETKRNGQAPTESVSIKPRAVQID